MTVEMLNEGVAPYGDLAEVDALDWALFLDIVNGSGVKSGCLVTEQGTPDGTVHVSGGVCRVTGSDKTIIAGDVSVLSGSANTDGSTSSAAHATLPRYDLIVADSNSHIGVIHGSTAVKTFANEFREKAVYPSWDRANQVVLGVIYVIPADQGANSAKIKHLTLGYSVLVNKGASISENAFVDAAHALSSATRHTGTLNDTQHGVRTLANAHALQDLSGAIVAGQGLGMPLALAGAVSATRYVGATASVAPTTGTFAVGDFVITQTGKIYICTSAGTPGTWVLVGGTGLAADTLWAAKGDIVVATADDAAAILTAPTVRQNVLRADDVGNVTWGPAGGTTARNGFCLSDEMFHSGTAIGSAANIGSLGPWSLFISGTQAQILAAVGEINHPGVVTLETGNTGTGRVHLGSGQSAFLLGGGRLRFGCWIKTPAALSSGTQRYEITAGFRDTPTGAVIDGAWFSYRDDVNSGKWQLNTSSNSTPTTVDSTTTVAAATWYHLAVEVNAAGTSVTFYINGVAVGSAITTNIPTAAGRETGALTGILKSVGTTTSIMSLDAMYLEQDFTTNR